MPAVGHRPGADGRARRHGAIRRVALRGTEDAEAARGHRPGARPGGRLRPAVVPVDAAVLGARQGARAQRQLGRCDHPGHLPAEARVLPAVGGERPLDGEDEDHAAAHQEPQETYKDDREKLGRAMMELYQREKINPVAGCLPIVIQIPVFLAFYWVLLESVEMRQAPFAFWIHDLSSRDPYFVLPAIMAAAMFAQYKLNPAPPDPVQAKVFMIMPIAMSATFAFFPAGLVLYWVTNTIQSIAQQWNINRRIEAAAAARRT